MTKDLLKLRQELLIAIDDIDQEEINSKISEIIDAAYHNGRQSILDDCFRNDAVYRSEDGRVLKAEGCHSIRVPENIFDGLDGEVGY